jgi:xanthine dehydrogenase iron-sulfur cluster and FAD-binding subunit A
MIYVGNVAEMKRIETFDDRLEIGAATPLTDCYAALTRYPDFGDLLHRFAFAADPQPGHLGGNIGNASPIGDSPPLLIALDAQVVLRQGDASAPWPWKTTSSTTASPRARTASSSRRSSSPCHQRLGVPRLQGVQAPG